MGRSWNWQLGIAVLLTAATVTFVYRRRRRAWRPVGKLSSIIIYPLKSGKGFELETAQCTPRGLVYQMEEGKARLRDRVFVIYDENTSETFTARKNSTLIFIEVVPKNESTMVFSHPNKSSIEVKFPGEKFEGKKISMWDNEQLEVLDCGDEIARWISELVFNSSSGLRVGYWPEQETWKRDILSVKPEEGQVFRKFTNDCSGSYSDMSSYHLINKSSVEDLNSKIEHPDKIEIRNFRPNFIIEGCDPYTEDKWDYLKIGDSEFRNFRPCTRCIFTTINYKNGEKHPKSEPLTTLRTYRTMKMLGESRLEGTIPVMGIFIGLDKAGSVKKGDTVYVC